MSDEKREFKRQDNGPRHGPGAQMRFEKPKNTGDTLKRLLSYLLDRKLQLAIVIVLMILSTAGSLAANYLLKPIINQYIIPGDFTGLARALVLMAGIYLVSVGASYGQSRMMLQIAQRMTNTMRRRLFEKLQKLPLKYFDTHTHGELMSRFTNDIDNVQMAFEQSLVQLISSSLTFVGSVIMMIVLSPILFLVAAVILGLMFFFARFLTSRSGKYFKDQQRNLGRLNGYVEEIVDGLKVVKVFNYEDKARSEFAQRNEDYREAATQANFYSSVIMPVVMNLNNISYAAVAMVGGLLTVFGRFDIGSLASFLQYVRQIGMPVQQISNQMNTILAALAGAERVFEVMDEPIEVDEGTVTLVGANKNTNGFVEAVHNGIHPTHWAWKVLNNDGSVEYIELKGDVRFNDVSFSYEPGTPVLNKVSLYAKPGQKIAFVGSTGAGKTTITNLINRFYDIEEGTITFDGINVKSIRKDDLRKSLGMVLQDTHLFTGTVMDNIRYGRLDASDAECIQAAKQASAHSFIKRLPQGYETMITADGANLSQGQRQLLAIARAAVADPPVLILDEATSSIDTRTERLIEKGMDALMKGRTVFVIAHRLSTVRNANAIIVLEHGEIIERGDHDDLLRQKGRYYRLATGQFELT
ncbi:MAG: ATP-binding cassette, subfamily multidrug efflux pump [Chloroflexota bacterium]|nr:ATP-binding cassette, subfamily multidrug efflux pump [Chloroflexota bacterium]